MRPTVSFVVPCFNYGRFVGQAIDSLLAQTFQDLELIVIDDASTDDSAEALERYRREPRVRILRHEQNQGHIASYNEGLSLARGEYVGILSADDFCLDTDATKRQIAVFEAHTRVGMVYTAHALVEQGDVVTYAIPQRDDHVRGGVDEFRHLIWGNYIPHSGTLLRREVQVELGPYDSRLPHSGDWDMWLRTAARHDVGYIAQPLYAYRIHPQNMSHRRVAPWQATEQLLLTLERAFAALPEDAPNDIRETRVAALRHALLQTAWIDLFHGRRKRTWQGIASALKHRPSLALGAEFWRFVPRLFLVTAMGLGRFRRTMERLERLRGRRPQVAP